MGEHTMKLSEADLERGLRDLGAHLLLPSTPDPLPATRHALSARRRSSLHRHSRLRDFARVAVAVAILAATFFAASPAARATVEGWLGLRGVSIHVGPAP